MKKRVWDYAVEPVAMLAPTAEWDLAMVLTPDA
jgi:hypothetical protein